MRFDMWAFVYNLLRKFKFYPNLTRIIGTSHEDVCVFVISCCNSLKKRNVLEKVVEKIKTRVLCFITFFPPEKCPVYEIVWKKYSRARQATVDNIMWRMRFACCVAKATDTHSEYVILIAFPPQWFRERASVLCYTYIACFVQFRT